MADDQDPDSKTEEPTEKKIRDAIEKGNIPVSKEASVLATFVAMLLIFTFAFVDGASGLIGFLRWFLDNPGEIRLDGKNDALELMRISAFSFGAFLLPIAGLIILLGVASSFLQNTPRLVVDRIQPKLNRISIRAGFGRIFSMNGAMEFLKSLLKLSIVTVVALIVLKSQQATALTTMYVDPHALPETILSIAMKLLSAICVATIALVGFDLVLARFQWRKNLRMTKQDLKDEYKQAEGDPIVKARMRSLARDRARKRMMSSVAEATVVVANPTHFAVALYYNREESAAPMVVAKGQDLLALKIKEIAYLNNVPVVEDKLLARSLYASVAIDQYIPAEYYRAVAEIISYVYLGRRN
ncbi:flagellar biosynthesis protein FlhB [Rhodobacteraceae bacterium RKSG542]|uniref:flagellar biosynthesis protein FlhB n=1 Tax=Pseudovibrio flavus TaxID=2529854 RepID=UPI0012BBA670|nr:flagellar biosynthesis protein FlhB [Pseudovibrio flavus]MTI16936.1 flagellar biosynthesis protein FlhB [Pseudovibrio flavus]